jgi:hypothetical protein
LDTKESARKEVNLLELIPEKNIGWEKDSEGFVVLLKPKFRHPFFLKHVLPRLKKPYYKVRLDEIGSFFWEHCNGHLTVKELADRMAEHFGESIDPLYERVGLFLQSLEKNQFIRMKGR